MIESKEELEVFETNIDNVIDAMKMAIEQEDYPEFFEIYGDFYCQLISIYKDEVISNTEYTDKIFSLIFDDLIPRSVDLVKESWNI